MRECNSARLTRSSRCGPLRYNLGGQAGVTRTIAPVRVAFHRGTYRAVRSRRRYIPKSDGRQRPLRIAALEDKIVQRAVVEVLNAIYEEDFLGFSDLVTSG
jgi:RNA-directed DNA polymerase